MMQLYSYFRSSTAYRARIALNLKGLDYKIIPVNLVKGEQRGEEHLARNPQGRVPVLQHLSYSLTQSMAIIEYLDDVEPEPKLVHGTPEQKAYIRQVSQAISCDIHPLTNLNVLKHLTEKMGASENDKNGWYAHFASTGMAAVEDLLAQRGWSGKYALGDVVSMADICIVAQMYNMRRYTLPLDTLKLCRAIERNCVGLQAFIDAAPETQPDAPEGLDPIHGPDAPLRNA